MSAETVCFIVVIVLLLGGGGYSYRGRTAGSSGYGGLSLIGLAFLVLVVWCVITLANRTV